MYLNKNKLCISQLSKNLVMQGKGDFVSEPLIRPNILKWARESKHMSLDEVAKKMNKKPEVISKWEEAQESPTYVQLEKLAYNVYKIPLAVFFFPEPPKIKGVEESFRTLPELEIERIPPRIIQLLRNAEAMQLSLSEMCNGINPAERFILHDITLPDKSKISTVVKVVREYLGVSLDQQKSWKSPDNALKEWRKVLEDVGVFVFKNAFKQPEFSGFCIYHNEFPIIYLNNSMPKTRQIFTLFHELAHLLFKTGGIDKVEDDYIEWLPNNKKRIEIFCNSFSGKFLVPEEDFGSLLRSGQLNISDSSISSVASEYGVSREVILRKLLDKKLISQDYYRNKAAEWTAEAQAGRGGNGGNYYATQMAYLGDRYLNLAFSEYYQNKISAEQLADYLNVRVSNLSSLETAWLGREV